MVMFLSFSSGVFVNLCFYMTDTFFLMMRCALGLTGLWIVWLIIDAFRGARQGDLPDDDPPGKKDPDSMDK